MKLLVVNDNPLYLRGKDYYAKHSFIRFPQLLARDCEKVSYFAPVWRQDDGDALPEGLWKFEPGELRIVHHEYYADSAHFWRLWPRRAFSWRRLADRLVQDHDAVVIRIPSPQSFVVAGCARRRRKPLIVIVAGDLLTSSNRIVGNRGLKRVTCAALGRLYIRWEMHCNRQAALTYVYNEELRRRHANHGGEVKLFQDPHVSLDDFVFRDDTCKSPEIKILRVAWLWPAKGLETLLQAMALLLARGPWARLEIVGSEAAPGYLHRLQDLAAKLGIQEKVLFTGVVPFDRMPEVYLRNDIQVISSVTEGTPRCIAEGAARGLPMVSTRAGGCADVLEHGKNALLVPVGDPPALAEAMAWVIKDGPLRRALIQGGYDMARSFAFENLGRKFIRDIENLQYCSKSFRTRLFRHEKLFNKI